MLTSQALLTALARTKRAVMVVALDGTRQLLEPAQAAQLVRDSPDWHGRGTKRKVSLISRLRPAADVKPDPVWSACFRNSEAAVLPPPPEYFLGMRSCVVSR